MTIFSFTAEFNSEESFRNYFKSERYKMVVSCNKCSHTAHY